jgi:protein SCO1/2
MRTGGEKRRGLGGRAGFAFLVLLSGLLCSDVANAFYKQEGTLRTRDNKSREEQNRVYFTDLPVITHEGKVRRFYTDILKDKVVLISFFYTNCPTAKPDTAKLLEIRGMLKGETEKKVHIVSISADPERDTPEALMEYADRYDAGKGWVLLTGEKESLHVINRKLGNTNPQPEAHSRVYLLGNLGTGHWIRLNQFAPSVSVAEGLRQLASE